MIQHWATGPLGGDEYLNIIVKDWSPYVLIPVMKELLAGDMGDGPSWELPFEPCKIERPLVMYPWEKNPVGWHYPGECEYHDYVIRVDWDLPEK